MQNLIKNGVKVAADDWQVYQAADDQGLPDSALLPVTFWRDHGQELQQSAIKFGAVVLAGEDIDELLPFLGTIKVVAIEFSKFADGRGFSLARQLRSLHGYQGEVRAFGDIMPDQVAFLTRCGFDAIACRSDAEADTAIQLSGMVSVQYQSDAVEPNPLFRRRS